MRPGLPSAWPGLLDRLRALGDYAAVGASQPRLAVDASRHLMRKVRPLVGKGTLTGRAGLGLAAEPEPPSLDRLIGHLGGRMGVLVLERSAQAGTVGVADVSFLQALQELGARAPLGVLQASGRPLDLRSLASRRVALVSPAVVLLFLDEDGLPSSLAVECYVRQGNGTWLSNNACNRVARAVYGDVLLGAGVHPVEAIVPAAPYARPASSAPVDVVYTWVNHADSAWAEAYRRARDDRSGAAQGGDAAAISRFHSNDELRFSLRSVAFNLGWVRRILILSNCAAPAWLDASHPWIAWIDHREVIPSDCLPTFSSHVIESFLHRIPGLSERFIYMNDDVFIARRMATGDFFDEAGRSQAFLEPFGTVSGPVNPSEPDHLNAARNGAALLLDRFGTYPTQLHAHTAFALRRDVLEEVEALWPAAFEAFRPSRFRSARDLSLTSFLYHHYALLTDRARLGTIDAALVTQGDVRWKALLRRAGDADVQTICVNEGGTLKAVGTWHAQVRAFMKRRFPVAAPWER